MPCPGPAVRRCQPPLPYSGPCHPAEILDVRNWARGYWRLKVWMRSENGFQGRLGWEGDLGWLGEEGRGGKELGCGICSFNAQQLECCPGSPYVCCWDGPRDSSAARPASLRAATCKPAQGTAGSWACYAWAPVQLPCWHYCHTILLVWMLSASRGVWQDLWE